MRACCAPFERIAFAKESLSRLCFLAKESYPFGAAAQVSQNRNMCVSKHQKNRKIRRMQNLLTARKILLNRHLLNMSKGYMENGFLIYIHKKVVTLCARNKNDECMPVHIYMNMAPGAGGC